MAKRYIRLNWIDRPSVVTPVNATNLNKMDKAINDIDDAVEDLYTVKVPTANIANNVVTTAAGLVLDARQGKALQDQVTTINNNLAGKIETFTVLGTDFQKLSGSKSDISVVGKIIHIHFSLENLTAITANTYYTIFTLPVALRPANNIFLMGYVSNKGSGAIYCILKIRVRTSGEVDIMSELALAANTYLAQTVVSYSIV